MGLERIALSNQAAKQRGPGSQITAPALDGFRKSTY
jgi:hypothetical protein